MSAASGGVPAPGLGARFREHLGALGAVEEGDRLLVALSGGIDSVVLLHLLRFGVGRPSGELAAAHVDHAMRPSSAADAAWVRGLARAWEVPLAERRLERAPSGEAEARRLRYAFLEEARREAGARWIVTAHHADDQAETVLFRALRGTGLRGLAGIPAVRHEASLLRPLLPFWREEIEAYGDRHRLPRRVDPTNREAAYARNVLRNEILPLAEARVAPGARRALVRLARLARREEAGWRSLLEGVLDDVVESSSEGRIVLGRSRFLDLHPSVRARVLRTLVRRLGPTPDEAGTRAALQFTSSGASGRRMTLPGGVSLGREFDRLVLSVPGGAEAPGGPASVRIPDPGTGEGSLDLGERRWLVRWSLAAAPSARPSGRWVEGFRPVDVAFPLRVRGARPGDRIRLSYGSKKLSKLFAEARVPAGERGTRPVLEDDEGRIVWVPGVARAAGPAGAGEVPGHGAFIIAIADADDEDGRPPARGP